MHSLETLEEVISQLSNHSIKFQMKVIGTYLVADIKDPWEQSSRLVPMLLNYNLQKLRRSTLNEKVYCAFVDPRELMLKKLELGYHGALTVWDSAVKPEVADDWIAKHREKYASIAYPKNSLSLFQWVKWVKQGQASQRKSLASFDELTLKLGEYEALALEELSVPQGPER